MKSRQLFRRWFFIVPVALVGLTIAVACSPWGAPVRAAAGFACCLLPEGAMQEWCCALDAPTAYAPGFSESGWRSIQVGMPEADVIKAIGVPLKRWYAASTHGPRELWEYSQSPNHGSFVVRTVWIDPAARTVYAKKQGVHWD